MNEINVTPIARSVRDGEAGQLLCELQEALSGAYDLSAESVLRYVLKLNWIARKLYPSGTILARVLLTNYEAGLQALVQYPAYTPDKRTEFIAAHFSYCLSQQEQLLVSIPPAPQAQQAQEWRDAEAKHFLGFLDTNRL